MDTFPEITAFDIPGRSVKLLERDNILGMTIYSIEPAIAPASAVEAELALQRQYTGFSQSGDVPQGDLTFNGSLFDAILPVIGYDEDKALDFIVTTEADQIPIGPGQLIERSLAEGREKPFSVSLEKVPYKPSSAPDAMPNVKSKSRACV